MASRSQAPTTATSSPPAITRCAGAGAGSGVAGEGGVGAGGCAGGPPSRAGPAQSLSRDNESVAGRDHGREARCALGAHPGFAGSALSGKKRTCRTEALRTAAVEAWRAEIAKAALDPRLYQQIAWHVEHARQVVSLPATAPEANLVGWVARYDCGRGAYASARTLHERELEVHLHCAEARTLGYAHGNA